MTNQRPSKTDYYLNIAKEVASRGTCLRRIFGAVIVKDEQVISTGYNGAPRGVKNCLDLGYCPRQKANIPAGERYELCRSVHGEANAIIHAARNDMIGATLYLYGEDKSTGEVGGRPCKMCTRMIINAGIIKVIVREKNNSFTEYLVENWVKNDVVDFDENNIKGY